MAVLAIAFQISSARRSSQLLLSKLRKELDQYRMVLLVPTPAAPASPAKNSTARVREFSAPRPLAVPDPRLLRRLDPAIAGFVSENPQIESIITREIVRDVDSKVLDVRGLLRKSSLKMSFDMDTRGHILKRRIVRSSGVPSIDHLASELFKLLEKYQMLGITAGIKRIVVSINIDREIEVSLEGKLSDPSQLESTRTRLQNQLTLTRFVLAKSDAAPMLKDITLTGRGDLITLSKSFEKDSLVAYLMRFYQVNEQK